MTDLLNRTPLFMRLADRIEEEIRQGLWKDILPGYRTLATHYGTSRKTAEAAIAMLERRGLVTEPRQGSRRRILCGASEGTPSTAKADTAAARTELLIVVSENSLMCDDEWTLLRLYGECWSRTGRGVSMAYVDYGGYHQPESRLKSLIETHQAGALVLHMGPHAWVQAAIQLLPVYLSGGERGDLLCDGDAFRISVQAARVIADLRKLGHQRILIPSVSHLPRFRDSAMKTMSEAFGRDLHPDLIKELCPVFAENVPGAWQSYWQRAFAKTAPTAVILMRDAHVNSLYGFCALHRIEIPRDLSVIHLGFSHALEWCQPPPRQMRYPARRAVANFREWIRNGFRTSGFKYLDLEQIIGESVAPASGHSASSKARR